MTEKSWPWSTVAGLGDGSSELGEDDARLFLATRFLVQDPTEEGVCKGVLNELEVTGAASPLAVDTGSAVCYGLYINDASVNLTVTTPSVGTTGGRVVLQTNWAGTGGAGLEARTRLAVVLNSDGNAAIPALTQSAGTTWEISLATFTITTGGVITLTDDRAYRKTTAEITAEEIQNRTRRFLVAPFPIDISTQLLAPTRGINTNAGSTDYVYGWFQVPEDYESGLTVKAVLQGSTGTFNVYGKVEYFAGAAGEVYNNHSNSPVAYAVAAVTTNRDVYYATTLTNVTAGDFVGLQFVRAGADPLDTAFAVYVTGFEVTYTADS